MKLLYVILSLALVGCSTPRPKPPAVSKLSGLKLLRKGAVSNVQSLPAPVKATVTITWHNAPSLAAPFYATGLVASVDLKSWTEVARLPYTASVSVMLSNRPASEFYRAFNTLK